MAHHEHLLSIRCKGFKQRHQIAHHVKRGVRGGTGGGPGGVALAAESGATTWSRWRIWWHHVYQSSGKPWRSSTSEPWPISTMCMFMPFTVMSKHGIFKSKNLANSLETNARNPSMKSKNISVHSRTAYAMKCGNLPNLLSATCLNDGDAMVRGHLITAAALTAATTYQNILSRPGGLWQETKGYDQTVGTAILDSLHDPLFFCWVGVWSFIMLLHMTRFVIWLINKILKCASKGHATSSLEACLQEICDPTDSASSPSVLALTFRHLRVRRQVK
ncbi:hypothetical protein Vadar_034228 [Vaccinium darrowii]|uniref:Uncharacterized protein n=1 Tax=Vaccinium darrowii TaxID=229202 RepID=A0ACB7XVD7_9ERIC|nr:hypothetical protein Vadar_034228 [Vaccinium darrowii]